MPNTVDAAGTRWPEYMVSIDQFEHQSGYAFLLPVAGDTQAKVAAMPALAPTGGW